MRVFISWSGTRSRAVAENLRTWLPDVVNFIDPWVSSEDIEKGARWSADLMQQLSETRIGIICLTPENVSAPWIHFEAGALSKALDSSRICTYLFQLRPSDLQGPLVQFQATEATELDTLRLLRTLNSGLGDNARSDDQLQRSFAKWWGELQRGLANIPQELTLKPLRSDRELLEEMLDLLRTQTRQSAELSELRSEVQRTAAALASARHQTDPPSTTQEVKHLRELSREAERRLAAMRKTGEVDSGVPELLMMIKALADRLAGATKLDEDWQQLAYVTSKIKSMEQEYLSLTGEPIWQSLDRRSTG